jgi:RNA polymerase sigma-70 factor (ECF subfamily)
MTSHGADMTPSFSTTSTAGMSFSTFVKTIEQRLMSYLQWSCRSGSDAEDLFQEVCLVTYDRWREVSVMDRPEAWVIRVAHNTAANHFRRRDTERRVLRNHYEPDREIDTATGERALESRELDQAVAVALQQLPADQREAIALKIWGGCTWIEIGDILGVSDDTAARLFARALRRLAPVLEPHAPVGHR